MPGPSSSLLQASILYGFCIHSTQQKRNRRDSEVPESKTRCRSSHVSRLLDMDSGGAVEIEEFLMGCLRLRGNAKAMDIAKLCHDQTWLIREQVRGHGYSIAG